MLLLSCGQSNASEEADILLFSLIKDDGMENWQYFLLERRAYILRWENLPACDVYIDRNLPEESRRFLSEKLQMACAPSDNSAQMVDLASDESFAEMNWRLFGSEKPQDIRVIVRQVKSYYGSVGEVDFSADYVFPKTLPIGPYRDPRGEYSCQGWIEIEKEDRGYIRHAYLEFEDFKNRNSADEADLVAKACINAARGFIADPHLSDFSKSANISDCLVAIFREAALKPPVIQKEDRRTYENGLLVGGTREELIRYWRDRVAACDK